MVSEKTSRDGRGAGGRRGGGDGRGAEGDGAGDDDALVTCCVSGERIRRADAVLVKLGAGRRVWMREEYTRERDRPER